MISSSGRYYYGLDGLRGILMLVGVLWHTVGIVSPLSTFVYDSPHHKSLALYALVYPEHLFRMEAFFLVSGFLSQMVLMRKGKSAFWRARIKRVLVPLLLGCFGVNLLLQIFGSLYMGYLWSNFDMWRWVMHGWFLITLLMCALIDMALPREAMARTGYLGGLLVAVIAVVGYVALNYWNAHAWHFWDPIKGNLFNFFVLNTVQFWPCYAVGALLYHHQERLWHIRPRTLWIIGVLAGTAALLLYLTSLKFMPPFAHDMWYAPLLYRTLHLLNAMGIAFLLFVWCYRRTRENGPVVRYLIASAMVVYLVHHPLVIIFGWALDDPALSNVSYFLLVTAATFVASFACFELIRRVGWLRFAFGLPQGKFAR